MRQIMYISTKVTSVKLFFLLSFDAMLRAVGGHFVLVHTVLFIPFHVLLVESFVGSVIRNFLLNRFETSSPPP